MSISKELQLDNMKYLQKKFPEAISIYPVGSNLVSWLDSHEHDNDYLVMFASYDELRASFKAVGDSECKSRQIDVIKKVQSTVNNVSYYSWQYHYIKDMVHLGAELDVSNTDILLADKQQVIMQLAICYSICVSKQNVSYKPKVYYHILMELYILDNQSYELTEDQKSEVQLAYDGNVSDSAVEYIKSKLEVSK